MSMGTSLSGIQHGMDVYGSDGDKVGDVSEVGPNYVLVTKGFLFTKDIYIPTSAITGIEQDRVYLNVTKDQVNDMGWDQPPMGDMSGTGTATGTGTAMGTGTGMTSSSTDASYGATTMGAADDVTTVSTQATTADAGYVQQPVVQQAAPVQPAQTTDDDSIRVRRYEEELQAEKVQRQAGAVRIEKDVVEEQRTLEVPVTHEEVHVRSVSVDRAATGTGDAFQEGVIEVPLMEQDVVTRKEVRVAEELEIDKTTVQETERVSDTVRREVVNIEEVGDVDVQGGGTNVRNRS